MPNTISGYMEQAAPVTAGSPYAQGSPAGSIPNVEHVDQFESFANDDTSATRMRLEQTAAIPVDFTDIDAIGSVNLGPSFPDNAVIIGAYIDVLTTFQSAANTATISLGLNIAGDLQVAAVVNGSPYTLGFRPMSAIAAQPPAATSFIKLTAARQLIVVTAVQVLTVGSMTVYVRWVPGA